MLALCGIIQRGIAVADQRLVGRPRPRVELAQHRVVQRARLAPGDRAVRIVLIAEDDGLGGACLLAGRHDLAVADPAVLPVGDDHCRAGALHAVGALLHHAAGADGHLGIPGLARPRVRGAVVEEIEASDLVRTVVGAEPRADAAVIDHDIDALRIMHCRVHRADHFARCVLALHARHRLKHELWALERTFVVPVDAQPVHLTIARDLYPADHRTVVFGLAGRDAGVAADAGIEIDAHGPGDAGVRRALVERLAGRRVPQEARILQEPGQRAFADEITAERAPFVLNHRELVPTVELAQTRARR